MLIHFGVTPYMVFDGDYLPSKAVTEIERAKRRNESKRVGLELHRMGKPSQAHLELQKAVDVTPEMARQLIDELKRQNIQYVVAPYEADVQLVYLEKKGIIQGILSEDSDLLVFGAKRLLTKLDQYGDCIAINRDEFTACREISLVGWSDVEFRRMAILSGCDYLPSINKMGLKTAYRLVRKYKTIEKILRMLQFDGQYVIPPGYLKDFKMAELTFLHQRVFCPEVNEVVMATDLGSDIEPEDFAFIGKHVESHIALGVARGDLHPMTKAPIVVTSRISGTSKSPWITSRRQLVATPSDLKPSKSIESYYTSKRTPLAELDPNSFTPSPSQQRLLEQNRSSWSSSTAPNRPMLSRSTTSLPRTDHAPRPQSVDRLISKKLPSSTPGPHPPKRQRLCEDPDEEPTDQALPNMVKVEAGRSRFFATPEQEPSPSMKRGTRGNRSKTTSINIWSDDSIEDAMARLPDVTDDYGYGRPAKVAVFRDINTENTAVTPHANKSVPDITTVSQTSSSTGVSTQLSQAVTQTTAASSVSSFTETEVVDAAQAQCSRIELVGLRTKFSHQPQSRASIVLSSKPNAQCITEPIKQSGTLCKPLLKRHENKPPTQQIQSRTLQRSQSCASTLSFPCTSAGTNKKVLDFVAPASLLVSKVDIDIPESPQTARAFPSGGSEDFMVPNSEDEKEESCSPSEKRSTEKSSLNLGRFAYKG